MKYMKISGFLLLIAGLAFAGDRWIQYQETYPSTDDAYVEANQLYLSPQIEGQVDKVLVKSYQRVKKGQLLVVLGSHHLTLMLEQAQSKLELAKTQLTSAEADKKSAQAQAKQAESEKAYLVLENKRLQSMASRGLASQQQADETLYKLKEAKARLDASRSAIHSAQARIDQAKANIATESVAVRIARLNLSYTRIYAPADGVLGEVDIRPGKFVALGEKLFPMISDQEYWVSANFKETDLHHIHLGQPVDIELDMYPDQSFQGQVESISPASGVAFSMIPSQNATGNWVKVTQRFPVRIKVQLNAAQKDHLQLLRIGSSATVTIDTHASPS